MKQLVSKLTGFVKTKAGKVCVAVAGLAPIIGVGSGLCAEGDPTPVITLTSNMFTPITDTVQANIGVLVGAGVSLMAINIGVSLIPRIVYKFF